MKVIARIAVTAAAVGAALFASAGVGAAQDTIGWPKAATGTAANTDGIGWPSAVQAAPDADVIGRPGSAAV